MLSEKASTKNPNKVADKIPVYKSWIGDLARLTDFQTLFHGETICQFHKCSGIEKKVSMAK